MRINVSAGAPSSVVALGRTIEQTCAPLTPTSPVNLASFSSTSLPSATAYPASMIYVSDLNTPAFSDGAHWYLLSKGAKIG